MDRQKKIKILIAIAEGKANIYDLLAGDGFFIKMGGFYFSNGTRYTEQQFEKIKEALTRQGKEPNLMKTGDSEISRKFVIKYTKPFG